MLEFNCVKVTKSFAAATKVLAVILACSAVSSAVKSVTFAPRRVLTPLTVVVKVATLSWTVLILAVACVSITDARFVRVTFFVSSFCKSTTTNTLLATGVCRLVNSVIFLFAIIILN